MKAFYQHLNKNGSPKVSYETLEDAIYAANEETMRVKCFRMVPYFCDYCNHYHIGKPSYKK